MQLRPADLGDRAIAVILDTALICFITLTILYTNKASAGSIIFSVLFYFFYFIIQEHFFGKTIGKRMMKVRVINAQGENPTWKESSIRNLLRIVDGLFFYLVGVIIAARNVDGQRIGDKVAETVTIDDN